MATTYIIECSVCQQPFEVDQLLANVPGRVYIVVPAHAFLDSRESKPSSLQCTGGESTTAPGIPAGKRRDWERQWPGKIIGRKLPAIRDGARVRLVQVI